MNDTARIRAIVLGLMFLSAPGLQAEELPAPDGKPADLSKPVQVFILLGQSNMLGFGKVSGGQDGCLDHAVKREGLYPFLLDDAGNWTERNDVRYVFTMGSGGPGGMGMNGGVYGLPAKNTGEQKDEPEASAQS